MGNKGEAWFYQLYITILKGVSWFLAFMLSTGFLILVNILNLIVNIQVAFLPMQNHNCQIKLYIFEPNWCLKAHDQMGFYHFRFCGLIPYFFLMYSSVQFTQSFPTLCNPMDCSMPGLPVHHQLPEFTQTHVHWVGDAIQPSHPLSSPSPPAFDLSQHEGLFQWVSSSQQVAKVLEFQLQHQPFQWTPRTDLL